MTKKIIYVKGQLIDKFVFIERTISNTKNANAKFQCSCGTIFIAPITSIKKGEYKSCGHHKKQLYTNGIKFNGLVLIEEIPHIRPRKGVFQCYCGKQFINIISKVKIGAIKSCGCLWLKKVKEANITHGDSQNSDSLYHTWNTMIQRCYNPNTWNYYLYGAKGRSVYIEWRNSYIKFKSYFMHNIGPFNILTKQFEKPKGHSIDRINNKGNYEPGNIRWATFKEQANNRG